MRYTFVPARLVVAEAEKLANQKHNLTHDGLMNYPYAFGYISQQYESFYADIVRAIVHNKTTAEVLAKMGLDEQGRLTSQAADDVAGIFASK